MSAATTPSHLQPIYTGITNHWARVRPSFFRGLAKRLKYAQDKLFGLILVSTVGWGNPWAKISWKRFTDVADITRRHAEETINFLVGEEDEDQPGVFLSGLIRRRKCPDGKGDEYSIAARPDEDSDVTGIAKCRGCGHVGEVDLDLKWIPVPHSFFLSLPHSCDHGMYLIVKTVVERTMRWDKKTRQIVVVPCEISIEEFVEATGIKKSEVIEDMQKVQAEGYEFIGASKVGRSNWYWARPENFAKGPTRAAREVRQPLQRNKREVPKNQEPAQPIETSRQTSPVEFVLRPCGVCRHCHLYGPMDMVDAAENSPKKPNSRAGPTESGPKKPKFILELERRRREAIQDAEGVA